MSADNGIYIAKFPDGYRVAHLQAIENIDYYPTRSAERKAKLKEYFGASPIFTEIRLVYEYAFKLQMEILTDPDGELEYGIQLLGEYESFE